MGIIKLWKLIRALKGATYDKVIDTLLPLILENKVLGPFLGKYKTIIAFILLAAYAILEHGQVYFPQYPWIPSALLIVGLILDALGIAHRGSKERRQE